MDEKFMKKFRAKRDFKAQHNEKFIDVKKGETYEKIDIFWEVPLLAEKVIERSK